MLIASLHSAVNNGLEKLQTNCYFSRGLNVPWLKGSKRANQIISSLQQQPLLKSNSSI